MRMRVGRMWGWNVGEDIPMEMLVVGRERRTSPRRVRSRLVGAALRLDRAAIAGRRHRVAFDGSFWRTSRCARHFARRRRAGTSCSPRCATSCGRTSTTGLDLWVYGGGAACALDDESSDITHHDWTSSSYAPGDVATVGDRVAGGAAQGVGHSIELGAAARAADDCCAADANVVQIPIARRRDAVRRDSSRAE